MPSDQWSFTRSGDDWMFKHIYDGRRLSVFVFPGGAYRSIFSAGLTVRSIKSDAEGRYTSLRVFVDATYFVIQFDEGVEQTYPMTRAAAVALREYLLAVDPDSDKNQLRELHWGSSVSVSVSVSVSGSRRGKRSRLSKKRTA
jgi:hypothetical protein